LPKGKKVDHHIRRDEHCVNPVSSDFMTLHKIDLLTCLLTVLLIHSGSPYCEIAEIVRHNNIYVLEQSKKQEILTINYLIFRQIRSYARRKESESKYGIERSGRKYPRSDIDSTKVSSHPVTGNSIVTRSSADADNGLDAFVGQSRSKNILNPFQVKFKKIIVNKK